MKRSLWGLITLTLIITTALTGCGAGTSPAERAAQEATASATPTVMASPLPSKSPTTTSPSPSPTTAAVPASYIGWDQIVAVPPKGLKSAINDHANELGWSWRDAKKWSEYRQANGQAPTTLIALVVEGGADPRTDEEKRRNVYVVQVAQHACTTLEGNPGCPTAEEGKLVLAPVIEFDGTTAKLLLSGGVVVSDEDYPIIRFFGAEVVE